MRAGFGVLIGLALIFAGIGFVEYATRSLLLNPKVIASNELEEYFRVNSLFFDPNIYGRFLALVMLGLAGVLLWERRRPARRTVRARRPAVPAPAGAAGRGRGSGGRAHRRARVPLGAAPGPRRRGVARRRDLRPLRADARRGGARGRPAGVGLGVGRVPGGVPRARVRRAQRRRLRLAHDPAHGGRRAGDRRPRRLPGAARGRARAAAGRGAQRPVPRRGG